MAEWDRRSITSQGSLSGGLASGGLNAPGSLEVSRSLRRLEKTSQIADDEEDADERRKMTQDQWTLLREHVRKNASVINDIRQEMQSMKAQNEAASTEGLRQAKKEAESMKQAQEETRRIVAEEKAARAASDDRFGIQMAGAKQQVVDNTKAVEQNRHNIEDVLQAQAREQDEKYGKCHTRMQDVESRVSDTLAKHSSEQDEIKLKHNARNKEIEALRIGQDSMVKTHADTFEVYKAEVDEKLQELKALINRSVKEERTAREVHEKELEAALYDKFEELKKERDASRTQVVADMRTSLTVMNKSMQQNLDGVAHDIAEEKQAREGQGTAMKKIIETLEREQMAALTTRMDAMREQLDRDRQKNETNLAEMQKQSESASSNLRAHVDDMNKLLGDKTSALTNDLKSHMGDVVKQFDGVLGNMRTMRVDITKESVASAANLKDEFNGAITAAMSPLDKRFGTVEKRVDDVELSYKELSGRVEDSRNELKAMPAKWSKEIADEATSRDAGDSQGKEALNTVNTKLGKRIDDLISDLENRKDSTVLDRLKQIEKTLQEHGGIHEKTKITVTTVTDNVTTLARKNEEDLKKEITTREGNVYELRELIGAGKTAHEGHCKSVQDMFGKERAAREAHKADVDSSLQNQKDALFKTLDSRITEESSTRSATNVTMQERIKYLEDLMQDSAEKHAALSKDHGDLHNKHKGHILTLQEQLEALKRLLTDEMTKEKGSREADIYEVRELISVQKNAHDLHCTTVKEGFESERAAREAAREEVSGAMKKHRDGISSTLDARLSEESAAGLSRHATVQERLKFLEDALQDSANKQAVINKDHSDQHNSHKGHIITLQEQLENLNVKLEAEIKKEKGSRETDVFQLREIIGGQKTTHEAHVVSVKELFDKERGARSAMKDEVDDNMAKNRDALSRTFDDRVKVESDTRAKHQASIQERLGNLKDHHDKHIVAVDQQFSIVDQKLAKALEAEKDMREKQVHDIRELIGGEKLAREGQVTSVKDMIEKERGVREEALRKEREARDVSNKDFYGKLQKESDTRVAQDASLKERIDYLERVLKDSADMHAKLVAECDVMRAKHEEIDGTFKDMASKHNAMMKDHGHLKEKCATHIVTVDERLAELDQKMFKTVEAEKNAREADVFELRELIGSEKLARELIAKEMKEMIAVNRKNREDAFKEEADTREAQVREVNSKHNNLNDAHNQLSSHHASMAERLEYIENHVLEHTEKHAKMLAEQDSMRNRHSQIEGNLNDALGRHESLVKDHGHLKDRHDTHTVTIEERLAEVDQKLIKAMDQERKSREAGDLELRELVGSERLAREGHVTSVKDQVEKERLTREEHIKQEQGHRLVKTRELDGNIQSGVEAHSKLVAHHASIDERIIYIEQWLNDSADKHAKLMLEQEAMRGKHTEFEGTFKDHSSRFNTVVKEHGNLKDKHDTHVLTFDERLALVDQKLLKAVDEEKNIREADVYELRELIGGEKLAREGHVTSVKELVQLEKKSREDQLKMEADTRETNRLDHQGKLTQQGQNHSLLYDRHASMEERIAYLEQLLQDSAEKQNKMVLEQANLQARHDTLETNHKGVVNRHDSLMKDHGGLKDKHGHHVSTVEERLDAIDQCLARDRLSREEIERNVEKENSDRTADVYELKELIGGEKLAREGELRVHAITTNELIEKERLSREETIKKEQADREALMARLSCDFQGKIQEQVDSHCKLVKHQASIDERIQYLEDLMNEQSEKHTELATDHGGHKETTSSELARLEKMIRDLAGAESTERSNNVRSLWERIQQLESIIEEMGGFSEMLKKHGDHHGKHSDRIVELQEILESLRAELRQERECRETEDQRLQELLFTERTSRESNVNDLHNNAQANHDKLHGAIGNESMTREEKHICIERDLTARIVELEKEVHGATTALHGAIGNEVTTRAQKHGDHASRLAELEKIIQEQQRALHGAISSEGNTRTEKLSCVDSRLAELEKIIQEQQRALHGAISSEGNTRTEKLSCVDSRLAELEKLLGSLVGKDALSDVQNYLKKLREEFEAKFHQLSLDQGRQDDDLAVTRDKLQREIIEESNKREFKCVELEEKIAAHKRLLEGRITDLEESITTESKHMRTRMETNHEELLGEVQNALKHNHEHFTAEIQALWDKCMGLVTHETTLRENAFLQLSDRLGGLELLLRQYMERPIVDMTQGKLSEEDLLPLQQKLLWLQQSLTADINKVASAFEAADKEQKFVIDNEQKRREATIVERLEKLNNLMDGRLKQEKQERQIAFDRVGQSVDMEAQERKRALAKVWAGMDSHTHDLTLSGGEEKSYERVEMVKAASSPTHITNVGATTVKTYSAPPVATTMLHGVINSPAVTTVHPRPAPMQQLVQVQQIPMGASIRAPAPQMSSRGLDASMRSSGSEQKIITTVNKSAQKVACGKASYDFSMGSISTDL